MLFFGLSLATAALAQTEVSGEVSGEWTVEGSPYIVVDSTWVPEGDSLTISAGTTVQFGENVALAVYGQLNVEGDEQDSVYLCALEDSLIWTGIFLIGSDKAQNFEYCSIRDCLNALRLAEHIELNLIHCTINGHRVSIIGFRHNNNDPAGCSIWIEDCTITSKYAIGGLRSRLEAKSSIFNTGGDSPFWGISMFDGTLILDSCSVVGRASPNLGFSRYNGCNFLNSPDSLALGSCDVVGDGSELINCYVEGDVDAKAFGGDVRIDGNIVLGRLHGTLGNFIVTDNYVKGGMSFLADSLYLANCTADGKVSFGNDRNSEHSILVTDCRFNYSPVVQRDGYALSAMWYEESEATLTVERCVIAGPVKFDGSGCPFNFSNNTLYADSLPYLPMMDIVLTDSLLSITNNIILGLGSNYGLFRPTVPGRKAGVISYNCIFGFDSLKFGGGEFILGETNIIADPMLVSCDPFDPNLQEGSPCIDAGDPNCPLDPDSTRADIGAYYFPHKVFVPRQDNPLPSSVQLLSVYPNPFNSRFSIRFQLERDQAVSIVLYDPAGREVMNRPLGNYTGGYNTLSLNGSALPPGAYYLRFQTRDYSRVIPVRLVK